jgi:hypothetical protein
VSDEDCPDLVPSLAKIAHVRKHKIDARLIFFRKSQSTIDNDDIVVGLQQEEILAHLSNAAEKDKPYRWITHLSGRPFAVVWRWIRSKERYLLSRIISFRLAVTISLLIGEKPWQFREIFFNRTAQRALMQRRSGMIHGHDKPIA